MKKQNLTATLPATRVTPEIRARVEAVAGAAEADIADVVRDALVTTLPLMELQLGLAKPVEVVEPAEPPKEDRTRGCFGGPPVEA